MGNSLRRSNSEKNCFRFLLPPIDIILSYFSFQPSNVSDLTDENTTPRPRCTEAQFKQMNIPLVTLAHAGWGAPKN